MPELKRNFSQALMNKDLDERLVPPGQYRDANNIEISTSEGSNVGTAQTIKGNTKRSATASTGAYSIPDTATCVGSIAALNTDKIYYLVSAGGTNVAPASTAPSVKKDYIMEYDPVLEKHKYVFVDIYKVNTTCTFTESEASPVLDFLHVPSLSTDTIGLSFVNSTGIRIGMRLTSTDGYDDLDDIRVTDIIYDPITVENVEIKRWKVVLNKALTSHSIPLNGTVFFSAPKRVLKFDKAKLITGINVLDDFIYWTDGYSEPKKISISRSIAGTGGYVYLNGAGNGGFDQENVSPNSLPFLGDRDLFHTRLVKGDGTNLSVVTKSNGKKAVWIEEKHIAVIKKGPTQALELDMYKNVTPRVVPSGVEATGAASVSDGVTASPSSGYIPDLNVFEFVSFGLPFVVGDILDGPNSIVFSENTDFRIGDVLRLSPASSDSSFNTSDNYSLRVEILENENADTNPGPSNDPSVQQDTYRALILSIKGNLSPSQRSYRATLEKNEGLFEFKLPRFSYRYKYQNGEYSTFAPWSEIAFLADTYNFSASQGYNLGMTNQLRSLVVRGYYSGEHRMMEDVVEIDILYKETNNPTVYVVKTINAEDGGVNAGFGVGEDPQHEGRGFMQITTDVIHKVVPSNQLLRPWDNVPRRALAQEVSANRLIYGNYLQNYNIPNQPIVMAGYQPASLASESDRISPSVKTMRDYTLGVVFSDEYGRETPVLHSSGSSNGVKVPKDVSNKKNRLTAYLEANTDIPSWAKYMSYYVKESSVEYYNLIMDRWYPAEDGNMWLSFPSSERNKVDENDFLILKKKNGSNIAVFGVSKYKVIDIQNEAPSSIKSTRTELGRLYDDNSTGEGAIGNANEGGILKDLTYFTIKRSELEETLGDDFSTNTPNMSVRFKGNDIASKIYKVISVSMASIDGVTSGDKYRFNIEGKFGHDIDFATNNTGVWPVDDSEGTGRIDFISVEFFQDKEENKPEFDGRFFIKVNRDPDLEEHILGIGQATDFSVDQSWAISYINNHWYEGNVGGFGGVRSALGGDQMPNDPRSISRDTDDNGQETSNDNRHIHPTEYQYHFDNDGSDGNETNGTRYYWGGHEGVEPNPSNADEGGGSHSLHKPSNLGDNWGLGNGYPNRKMFESPIEMMNDMTQSTGSHELTTFGAYEYWAGFAGKDRFFIDGASAYSWTSFNGFDGQTQYGSWGSDNYFETEAQGGGVNDFTGVGAEGIEGTGNFVWESWALLWTSEAYGDLVLEEDFLLENLVGTTYHNSIYQSNTDPFPDPAGNEYWAMGFGASEAVAANMLQNAGLPSRAIRGDQTFTDPASGAILAASYMDFSWTGVGRNQNPPTPGETPQQIDDVPPGSTTIAANGNTWTKVQKFAEKMVTPGTRFRFQNDPDETVYTVRDYKDTEEGYGNLDHWKLGSNRYTGAFGIRNFRPVPLNWNNSGSIESADEALNTDASGQFSSYNTRQRWSIVTTPEIGSGPSGYNPITGTKPPNGGGPAYGHTDYRRALHHDGSNADVLEILSVYNEDGTGFSPSGAVFETQPKESVDLDIYYQASELIPLVLDDKTNEEFIPLGSTFKLKSGTSDTLTTFTVTEWTGDQKIKFTPKFVPLGGTDAAGEVAIDSVGFKIRNGDSTTAKLNDSSIVGLSALDILAGATGYEEFTLHGGKATAQASNKLHAQTRTLGWNNCWVFGNGVESDRVRDDYNAPHMDNGVKASSTVDSRVKEEHRKHGLIWSGIYNSTSGINETNQFIMAEAITKDLNPIYGSIQKLYNRGNNLAILCEDKVLKAVTDKDALYNADGSAQLLARKTVVGDTTTYQGDYGISTNPESFVATPYQMFFTDAVRGQVLRMTTEGIVSISDKGMKNYFADIMASNVWRTLGSFDERKKEYNLSILKKSGETQIGYNEDTVTVSYGELSKGWTSFKSFIPQNGLSINNKYFTFYDGHIWEHYTNDSHNNFYTTQYTSDITVILNDKPESVKSFGVINYEGSQAKVSKFTDVDSVDMLNGVYGTNAGITVTNDITGANPSGSTTLSHEYFNLESQAGWYVDNITTDKQKSGNIEFKEKEGKWFGFPNGETTTLDNLDEKEFTVQGLGTAVMSFGDSTSTGPITITVENNTSLTYDPDGTGVWDQTIGE